MLPQTGLLKIQSKSTGEYSHQSVTSTKLHSNCIEITLWHRRYIVNILFHKKAYRWLLLKIEFYIYKIYIIQIWYHYYVINLNAGQKKTQFFLVRIIWVIYNTCFYIDIDLSKNSSRWSVTIWKKIKNSTH